MTQHEVASLENCKELYELSGWYGTHFYHRTYSRNVAAYSAPFKRITCGKTHKDAVKGNTYPAYSLGYLLRKLPRTLYDNKVVLTIEPATDETWNAAYSQVVEDGRQFGCEADTPENALCELAVKLFKQNILTKESS